MKKRIALALSAVMLLLLTSCDVTDLITSPRSGAIVEGDTIVVTGKIPAQAAAGGTVEVNGVAGTFTSATEWQAEIPASPVGYVTIVQAVYTAPSGTAYRQQSAVVNGPAINDGEFSPDGVGMKFTNTGLANLGPVINNLAGSSFDISGLILAQDPLLPSSDVGLGHSISGKAYEAGAEGVSISAQSNGTALVTPITIKNLYLGLDLQLSGPILSGPCKLELQIPTITIGANFDLKPDAAQRDKVDVNLIGSPNVQLQGTSYEFISGICDPSTFLIGSIINSLAGSQITGSITSGFNSQLGDPDGSGPADSPIAEAIETALAEISIAGPVGDAVKAQLNAPFTRIDETTTGLDFRADADFVASIGDGPNQCQPPAGAPDLTSSFDVPGVYPTLGGTSPGGQPYGLGLVISTSAFNQLLSAMTECGILNQDIHELDLGGVTVPITRELLMGLIPAMSGLQPGADVFIRVTPSTAPFLTSSPGPGGAMGEMRLADLRITFVQNVTADSGESREHVLLDLGVEAPLGLSMGFDPVAGQLAPTITPPAPADVRTRVVYNNIGANEVALTALFSNLFPNFVSSLGDSFAAFPLPAFLGLQLNVLEVARQGNSFVLYANLDPAPQTKITNVAVTDLSTGDFATDSVAFDSNEWRHRLRKQIGTDQVRVDFKGVVGADACCFADDERADAHAGYRVTFNVEPAAGETWRLDLAQMISGAHTVLEEDLGSGWTSISTITGRARIGAGAWQSFNATPSSTGANNTNNRTVTDNRPFTGSNSSVLTGTTTQTITVEIGFDVTAYSDSTTSIIPPRAWAGDEAAVRIGANDSLTNNFQAGDYPGVGNRNIANDGHVLTIGLSVL